MDHWKLDLDNPEHAKVFLFVMKRLGRQFAFTGQGESDASACWAAKILWKQEFEGATEEPSA